MHPSGINTTIKWFKEGEDIPIGSRYIKSAKRPKLDLETKEIFYTDENIYMFEVPLIGKPYMKDN